MSGSERDQKQNTEQNTEQNTKQEIANKDRPYYEVERILISMVKTATLEIPSSCWLSPSPEPTLTTDDRTRRGLRGNCTRVRMRRRCLLFRIRGWRGRLFMSLRVEVFLAFGPTWDSRSLHLLHIECKISFCFYCVQFLRKLVHINQSSQPLSTGPLAYFQGEDHTTRDVSMRQSATGASFQGCRRYFRPYFSSFPLFVPILLS